MSERAVMHRVHSWLLSMVCVLCYSCVCGRVMCVCGRVMCVLQLCVVVFFSDGLSHERARTFIQQMHADHVSNHQLMYLPVCCGTVLRSVATRVTCLICLEDRGKTRHLKCVSQNVRDLSSAV